MTTLALVPDLAEFSADVPEVLGADVPARVGRSSVRLTRRGRLFFGALFFAVALALMVGLGGWAMASRDAGEPVQVRIVQVKPGDTLYGFAAELAGPGEIRDVVHQIRELNALTSGGLQAGQSLAIPVR